MSHSVIDYRVSEVTCKEVLHVKFAGMIGEYGANCVLRKFFAVFELQGALSGAVGCDELVRNVIFLCFNNAIERKMVFGGAEMNDSATFGGGPVCRDAVTDIFDGFREGRLDCRAHPFKTLFSITAKLSDIFINKWTLLITHAPSIHLLENRGK